MTDRTFRFSEIQRFKWCRRSWLNGYHLGLEKPRKADAPPSGQREVGTLLDRAIRFYYWDGSDPVATVRAEADKIRAEIREAGNEVSKAWEDEFFLAERMAGSYMEYLETEGVDAGEITMGVELEVHWTLPYLILGDRVTITGHIDRLVLDTTWDQIILEDTKTVGTLEKHEQFQVDDQLLTYATMLQEWGLPVRRARHNMVKKVARKTANAKPPFCGRVEVEFNDEQIASHRRNLTNVCLDLVRTIQSLEADQSGGVYPSPSRDCTWKCDFLPICTAHDDGSDLPGLRDALYVKRPKENLS